jgi:hypothetical protein
MPNSYWFPLIVYIVSAATSICVSAMIENLLEIRRINKATKNILSEIPDFSIIANKMRDKKKEHIKNLSEIPTNFKDPA